MLTCVNLFRQQILPFRHTVVLRASCGSSQGYADLRYRLIQMSFPSRDHGALRLENPGIKAIAVEQRQSAIVRVRSGARAQKGIVEKNPHRGGFTRGTLCHHPSAVPAVELGRAWRCRMELVGALRGGALLATFPDRDHLNPWQDLIGNCRE